LLGYRHGTLILTVSFAGVLANVIGNREINEITEQDFLVVGSRYSEWYRGPLRAVVEAYDARAVLTGHPAPERGPWPSNANVE
jgi:hypothetical protein